MKRPLSIIVLKYSGRLLFLILETTAEKALVHVEYILLCLRVVTESRSFIRRAELLPRSKMVLKIYGSCVMKYFITL